MAVKYNNQMYCTDISSDIEIGHEISIIIPIEDDPKDDLFDLKNQIFLLEEEMEEKRIRQLIREKYGDE